MARTSISLSRFFLGAGALSRSGCLWLRRVMVAVGHGGGRNSLLGLGLVASKQDAYNDIRVVYPRSSMLLFDAQMSILFTGPPPPPPPPPTAEVVVYTPHSKEEKRERKNEERGRNRKMVAPLLLGVVYRSHHNKTPRPHPPRPSGVVCTPIVASHISTTRSATDMSGLINDHGRVYLETLFHGNGPIAIADSHESRVKLVLVVVELGWVGRVDMHAVVIGKRRWEDVGGGRRWRWKRERDVQMRIIIEFENTRTNLSHLFFIKASELLTKEIPKRIYVYSKSDDIRASSMAELFNQSVPFLLRPSSLRRTCWPYAIVTSSSASLINRHGRRKRLVPPSSFILTRVVE
ncbi:hypothetical protein LXL04_024657 [Taraxacum kok-saghyz]